MKLQSLFLLTHALPAIAVGGVISTAPLWPGPTFWLAPAGVALATVGVTSFVLARKFRANLAGLQAIVATPGGSSAPASGIDEWDRTAVQLSELVIRWDETAANGHEQSREFQALLALLDRRGGGRQATGAELRRVLASIGLTLHAQLIQWEQGAAEIGRCTQEIAEGAEVQSNAVIKTSTYMEQLTANIDSVASDAKLVQTAILTTQRSTGDAAKLVSQLLQGMDRIRAHCEASEKKIRGLSDPSRQISSIVETISDIAARTDLLALNASIESVRAGEHGRGFAVVAEEVRKLAEQAAQATREIAGLIESMQLATQESIGRIAQQRTDVEGEVQLVETTGNRLEQICQTVKDDASRAGEITLAAHRQLQLTQDVVLAIEQISNVAKTSRGRAENACWTVKSLATVRRQFDETLEPLRRCGEKGRGEALTNHTGTFARRSDDGGPDDDPQPLPAIVPLAADNLSAALPAAGVVR